MLLRRVVTFGLAFLAAAAAERSFADTTLPPLARKVVFQADDLLHGQRVYITDGTTAGTHALNLAPKDAPGVLADSFSVNGRVGIQWQGASNKQYLFFVDAAGVVGPNLLQPPAFSAQFFRVIGTRVYYQVQTPTGPLIYSSDGTKEGTRSWGGIPADFAGGFFGFAGVVYLPASHCIGCDNNEITVFRLTASGPKVAWTYRVGPDGCCLFSEARLGSRLLFFNWTLNRGTELWSTDGVSKTLVKDIDFGQADGVITNRGAQVRPPLVLGNRLIFLGRESIHGLQLWSSNGTSAGTVRISSFPIAIDPKDPTRPFGAAVEIIESIKIRSGIGYFLLRNSLITPGAIGASLWQIDGTPGGTRKIKLTVNNQPLLPMSSDSLAIAGDWIYLSAMKHPVPSCNTTEPHGDYSLCDPSLYRVNVKTHVAQLVKNINPTSAGEGYGKHDVVVNLTSVGTSVIFSAADRSFVKAGETLPTFNSEPWRTGGTAATTVKIKEIALGFRGSDPSTFIPY